jgi:hypothetical protein
VHADFDKAIQSVCEANIESVIGEKLGHLALRVFRLLSAKGFLDEDQVK